MAAVKWLLQNGCCMSPKPCSSAPRSSRCCAALDCWAGKWASGQAHIPHSAQPGGDQLRMRALQHQQRLEVWASTLAAKSMEAWERVQAHLKRMVAERPDNLEMRAGTPAAKGKRQEAWEHVRCRPT